MMTGKRARRRRRGYSLAELILGAAVLAAFAVRVFWSYTATHQADQYEDFITQMNLVAGQAVTDAKNQPDYSQINDAAIAHYLPRSMILQGADGSVSLVTPYRLPMTVKPVDVASGGTTFPASGLEIDAIMPSSSCYKLAMAAPEVFTQMGALKGKALGSGSLVPFPIDNVGAVAMCGNAMDPLTMMSVRMIVADKGYLAQ